MNGIGAGLRALLEPRWFYLGVSVALCFLVMAPFYWPAAGGVDVTGQQIGRDFINNWAGPRIAWHGHLATLFDLQGYVDAMSREFGRPLPFMNWGYPPFTLIAFWPLAQLPYFWALAVWTVGLFAIFARVGVSFVATDQRRLLLLSIALAPACIINTVGGQNGFLSGALMLGGVLLLDRRPILAGVLFGLLTFKPQLGLVLPLALIVLRAWRTIGAAVITTAVLVASSIAVFGTEPWRHYLTDTSAFQLSLLKDLHGFYPYMMTSVLAEAHLMGLPFAASAVLQALVSIPVLVLAGWAMRWTGDPRRRAFILVAAAPLITPYAFNYDLAALSVVIAWRLIEDPPARGSAQEAVLRIAWLTPIVLMPLNMAHIGLAPLALLAVFALAVGEIAPVRWRDRMPGWIIGKSNPN